MKKLLAVLTLLILVASANPSHGQVKTNISLLTEQETTYFNTAKSLYKEYQKLQKQYLKDSTKLSKKAIKRGRAEAKGFSEEEKSKVEAEVKQEVKILSDSLYQAYGLEDYELQVARYDRYRDENGKIDWHTLAKASENEERLSKLDEYQQVQELKGELRPYTSEYGDIQSMIENPDSIFSGQNLDHMAESQLMQLDEVQELSSQSAELKAIKDLPEQYQKMFKQYQDRVANAGNPEYLEHQAKQHAKAVGQTFMQKNSKILSDAQTQVGQLKKKYSTVLSLNDLSTATKASSLEGEPLGERIILGGNFQITRQAEQTNLDISPIIGYKINRNWSLGISGVYRATFGKQDELFNYLLEENIYGGRVFTQFIFWKGFFGQGEYERMNNALKDPANDVINRVWVEGINIGIGKNYKVTKALKGNVMVLYNTIYNKGVSPYKSPWQVRFGIGKW